ncbi:MAG: TolB family protein [candidate division WOR-3 bacterium]
MISVTLCLLAQGPWIVFTADDPSDTSTKNDVFLWKCPGTPGCDPFNLTCTPTISEYAPAWKPNASSILFCAAVRDTHRLWIAWPNDPAWPPNPCSINSDSVRNSRPIDPPMTEFHGGATWYPDAETIAFYRRRTTCDIFIFKYWDAGGGMGSGTAQLTFDYEGTSRGPDVRSGDHRFVYTRQDGCNYYPSEVYTMNPNATGVTQLTSDPSLGFNDAPGWSHSGNKIVYVSTPDGGSNTMEIWVMNADGSGKTRLTNNSFRDFYPVWFQDSIYFLRTVGGETDIWIMDTLGNNSHPVSDTSDNWSIVQFDVILGPHCLGLQEERGYKVKPIISPLPSGLLFLSHDDLPLRIYSADGHLAYSGELKKGENRISLETGVYFWIAGPYKGKAVIR